MLGTTFHRYLFVIGSVAIACGLSISPFLLSVGQFLIATNWILELNYKQKFHMLKTRKSISWFCVIYLVHVVWLLNTSNFSYAFHDLKIKLPLLILPILYGSSKNFNKNELRIIFHFFILATFISTLISAYIYFGFTSIPAHNSREASILISHIRFSMLVVISVYLIAWLIIDKHSPRFNLKLIYIFLLLWCLFFIFVIGAFTGMAILIITIPIVAIVANRHLHSKIFKFYNLSFVFILIFGSIVYFLYTTNKFYSRNSVDFAQLEKVTLNGNKYTHFKNMDYENKNRIWIYICYSELNREWKKRSDLNISQKDYKGNSIEHTLIRYLTSLGYRKDSVGVSKLSNEDVQMIENGYSNHLFKKKYSIYPRLYQLYWEIENYKKHGNPNGYSLALRIEYLKNTLDLIKRKCFFGTGTGDIGDELKKQYQINNSILDERWQLRAHNQFVTFVASFGIIGFILILIASVKAALLEKKKFNVFFISFLLIIFISMLSEDTLETQAGASIVGFFISLFIWGMPDRSANNKLNET